jgi:iron complex transport system substrate-binding protein
MKRTTAAVAAALAALVVLTASGTAAIPEGRQESTRAGRIVSIIPAVTEMLFAMDAGPQLVAVGSFDRYPPAVERLERVGALLDPDLEKILGLRPDLVVLFRSQVELHEQLRRAGIPTFLYTHGGLADITATMRQLGARIGRAMEAERAAARIEARLDEVRRRVSGGPRVRTMVVFGREARALRGIYASGGVGFLHDMLELAGGTNVFAEVKRENVQVSTELIIAQRPEAIVELRVTPLSDAELRAELDVWKVLASVPAVRNERVHIIADERMVIPGPRVVDAAELLAKALHPERWGERQPQSR